MDVAAELDIVQNRHVREKFNILKRSRNAQGRYAVGFEIGNVAALKDDPAPVGLVKAVNAIQQAGLAGAVRSDN